MDAGIQFILFLQTQEWAFPIMKSASSLGSLEFLLFFMPFLFWCCDSRLGFRVGLILALGQGLNSAIARSPYIAHGLTGSILRSRL